MKNFKAKLKLQLKYLIDNHWDMFFKGSSIILVLLVLNLFFPRSKSQFDCSERAEVVVEKVLMCEQSRTNEKIRIKEIELERYKVDQDYKFNTLKEKLLVIKEELKTKGFSDSLSYLGVESLNASRELLRSQEGCSDEVIRSMCKVVN